MNALAFFFLGTAALFFLCFIFQRLAATAAHELLKSQAKRLLELSSLCAEKDRVIKHWKKRAENAEDLLCNEMLKK